MVSFVGATDNGANATTFNLTWPGGLASGDVAVVTHTLDAARTPTTPSGFTEIFNDAGGAGSTEVELSYKILTGTETGNLAITISGGNEKHSAAMSIYRGLHPTSPVDTFASFDETASGITHACPSVTTGFNNCVILVGIGERAMPNATTTWVAPPTYTLQATGNATGGPGPNTSAAVADDGLAPGRTSGTLVSPGVWMSGSAVNTKNDITWTLSLRPKPPTGVLKTLRFVGQGVNRASTY